MGKGFSRHLFALLLIGLAGLTRTTRAAAMELPAGDWWVESALALPQPLAVGIAYSCADESSFFCARSMRYYADTGYFRYPIFSAGDKSVKELSLEVGARKFPFSSVKFFGALGLGYRSINVSANLSSFTIDGEAVASGATLGFRTLYLAPSVGYLFEILPQLSLDVAVGLQIPVLGSGAMVVEKKPGSSIDPADLQTDSALYMGRIAKLVIPTVTLLRLQWHL